MRDRHPFYPLRGFSPYRALAIRLREQFRAEDAARAAVREAEAVSMAPRAAAAGAAPATPRRHTLYHGD